jgi:hypothetical protein
MPDITAFLLSLLLVYCAVSLFLVNAHESERVTGTVLLTRFILRFKVFSAQPFLDLLQVKMQF